jgi:ribosomal protein RSM22 (predicted rRNA methylase)
VSADLPSLLRAAIARELEGVSRKDLAARADATSRTYRAGGGSAATIRSDQDALAYALTRLPATYAACERVLAEAGRIAPEFRPRTLLDAGAGPGGGSWAAVETWPGLEAVTWLDASAHFLGIAAKLASGGPGVLANAAAKKADLAAGAFPHADLVLCSYALAEIAEPSQARVVDALWAACDGVLALVEPGTPAGFARLRKARDQLIGAGAHLLAPCPHAAACPMVEPDWCHFSVRLPRSRDHRLAKGAEVPFEDERFAYLLVARQAVEARPGSRILAPPRTAKPGIDFKLCTPTGLERGTVAKRDKTAFAAARRADWGDLL